MTKEDANEEHLIHYITYCKEKGDKNHINAAKILANEIIEYYEKNPDNNKQFQKFVSDNMSKLLPEHNDSVDAKAIILLLQQEIIDLGYIITSLIPIRLMKKTIH